MRLSDYQELSKRTQVKGETKNETLNNILLGLYGELGEVLDIIKKHEHHGHTLDLTHLEEEFGDFLFYVVWLMSLYSVDGDYSLYRNVNKLKERYPDGFSSDKSINREE